MFFRRGLYNDATIESISIYQDLPLIGEDEYIAAMESESHQQQEEDSTMEDGNDAETKPDHSGVPEDPHERMVARLKHEVAERQRRAITLPLFV